MLTPVARSSYTQPLLMPYGSDTDNYSLATPWLQPQLLPAPFLSLCPPYLGLSQYDVLFIYSFCQCATVVSLDMAQQLRWHVTRCTSGSGKQPVLSILDRGDRRIASGRQASLRLRPSQVSDAGVEELDVVLD